MQVITILCELIFEEKKNYTLRVVMIHEKNTLFIT